MGLRSSAVLSLLLAIIIHQILEVEKDLTEAGGPGPGDFFYSTTLRVLPVPRFWGPGMAVRPILFTHFVKRVEGHEAQSLFMLLTNLLSGV
jgi:hypothetical protein